MKPASFHYHAPTTLDDVLQLLALHGDEAKLLAGGQSLVPAMNVRLAQPTHLIDINALTALAGVTESDEYIRIGALTRHHDVARAPLVRERLPILAEAERHIAHYAIRQRGTFGGSLCHADPAAEWPLMAALLDAELCAVSPQGMRQIAAQDFFQSVYTTALAADELLLHADIMPLAPNEAWAYRQISRRAGDFAIVAVAVTLRLDGDKISAVRMALGGVSDRPVRLTAQEQASLSAVPDAAWISGLASETATQLQRVNEDIHADAEYRRDLVRYLLTQALEDALQRAQGES
ncbi:MAG: xanthine dehydrogenase family protein subunit M [Candidatus Competibacteraceae bacterium]|nr:xanthine dehydrogenase family protein subunit M [Candidatus Competibacteraceae bacterium]MCB1805092.1 xanthine dehydrogenase family protein subunit M [Candidatus Competibacteraceae bacterium]MCB1810311.1 xanthine dehydrogenase family protein subunit M [Candidatus Competibacteraceae bacterium]